MSSSRRWRLMSGDSATGELAPNSCAASADQPARDSSSEASPRSAVKSALRDNSAGGLAYACDEPLGRIDRAARLILVDSRVLEGGGLEDRDHAGGDGQEYHAPCRFRGTPFVVTTDLNDGVQHH